MEAANENLTTEVRHFLGRRANERAAGLLGTKDIFFQSQSWDGYARACDSWHIAFWKWVDDAAPAELVERLKGLHIDWPRLRDFDWSRLPCTDDVKKSWFLEQTRQEFLSQFALFKLAMRGPEAEDAETYEKFFGEMKLANRIGAKSYFVELAKQKQRKPSKGSGDRRLKYQLLFCEIPGCLWAFAKEGMAHFLNDHYPRSGNKPYNKKTISDARRTLKLYHLRRPLWWGVMGTPPSLQPLR